ncbi:hypothetical protein [Rhodococcoides fascians]|nr:MULTISPECIES: hypothetical protein [Rhodococcus]
MFVRRVGRFVNTHILFCGLRYLHDRTLDNHHRIHQSVRDPVAATGDQ